MHTGGTIRPKGRAMAVPALYRRLRNFHSSYTADTFPDLSDDIDLELFNAYRFAGFPKSWPRLMRLNSDARGTLFEVAKGHSGGQTFVSWTKPGVTRGDHFHLNKVERFAVLQGRATIRVRRVLTDTIWTCEVTGETPVAVDMPTLHTHSLENTGTGPLLTLFAGRAAP